jgi:hypothetical protein
LCFALPVLAKQAPPTRIRGTIEAVDLPTLTGGTMTVTYKGQESKIALTPETKDRGLYRRR